MLINPAEKNWTLFILINSTLHELSLAAWWVQTDRLEINKTHVENSVFRFCLNTGTDAYT